MSGTSLPFLAESGLNITTADTLAANISSKENERRVKAFLDSDEVLSVQLHPDDDTARRHGLPNGKTEAWHILAAEPDAWLAVGTADGATSADVLSAIDAGADADRVRDLLHRVPARPGDTWLVDAGTIHALGPGVTMFEIQQTSDATWRLYDWDREPRRELPPVRDQAGEPGCE